MALFRANVGFRIVGRLHEQYVQMQEPPHRCHPPAAQVFDIVQLFGVNHITRERDIRGVLEAIL